MIAIIIGHIWQAVGAGFVLLFLVAVWSLCRAGAWADTHAPQPRMPLRWDDETADALKRRTVHRIVERDRRRAARR